MSQGLVNSPLATGTNQIGSVTVSNFVAPNVGNVTLNASNANIGSVSILGGVVSMSNFVSPNVGNVSLNASSANIGSVSVLGGTIAVSNFTAPNTGNVTLNASNANIGSVSILGGLLPVSQSGVWNANVSLGASAQYIGLVTAYPGRSLTTSMGTIYSAAGNSTMFVPPNGQRWYLHSLFINAQGLTTGELKSGTKPLFPFVGLSTLSGLTHTIPDPGLPAAAINEAFVVNLNSAATISIVGTFHFE